MYKRRLPDRIPHLIQVVDIVSLVFNQTTSQHDPNVEVSQAQALYMQDMANVAQEQGQPVVQRLMHYFSFIDPDIVISVGWYVEDENTKRWLIKEVVSAGLAGGRVLCKVEAI